MIKNEIKYAYLIGDLGAGGQEAQLVNLVTEFTKNKEKVLVVVWNDTNINRYQSALISLNIKLLVFPSHYSFLKKIYSLNSVLKKSGIQILHSYSFFLNFACYLSVFNTKAIAIGGIRNNIVKSIKEAPFILGILCAWFPKFKISNNYSFKAGVKNPILKKRLSKTFIITNHLNVDAFNANEVLNSTTQLCTASISRLYSEKRVDLLVNTISSLIREGFQLVHFHAGKGPLKEKINELIISYNLEQHFILCNEIEDVNVFLQDKLFLIHSSDYEGFPNVIMEAMACGKPIITTDCGDAKYLVENNRNGYVVPKGDVQMLTENCMDLLRNEKKRKQMGKLSRQKAEQLFKIKTLYSETVAVYKKLIRI